MKPSQPGKLLELAREVGVIRSKDLAAHGIHRENLRQLEQKGLLIRIGRGLYSLSDVEITENHTLAEAAKRVPHAVVCLLSALRFHELTTQAPFEVWIAIDVKARAPKEEMLPLRLVYMSGNALSVGIETHRIEGVPVKIYNLAKTVVDCFKYRNQIGLDVALEALRECWRERRCTADELWHYAKICRMSKVMRPYLESLT